MTKSAAAASDMPILPAHIEDTVRAIAKLHADHAREAGPLHRFVERLTAGIARPGFIVVFSLATLTWMVANTLMQAVGRTSWDPPPFVIMETLTSLLALYVTVLILTTQRRDDQIATYREQLTLELAILGEQKSAKIIALLEEIRQEHPHLQNRTDSVAKEMSVASDPEIILNAIKDSAAIDLEGG